MCHVPSLRNIYNCGKISYISSLRHKLSLCYCSLPRGGNWISQIRFSKHLIRVERWVSLLWMDWKQFHESFARLLPPLKRVLFRCKQSPFALPSHTFSSYIRYELVWKSINLKILFSVIIYERELLHWSLSLKFAMLSLAVASQLWRDSAIITLHT